MPDLRIGLIPSLLFAILGLSRAAAPLQNNDQPPRTTPLTLAIRLEKFNEAKKHITPELVNQKDQGKYHPLTYAVYTGNNELIEALLKAGADANVIEHNGKTALYVAANLNNAEGIKLLHQYGATYPSKDSAYQPAKTAVQSNAPDVLKALLESHPSIDLEAGWKKPDRFNKRLTGSPLNYAARHGYNDVGLILLKYNCKLDAALWAGSNRYTGESDWRGKKALHSACENPECSTEFISALLAAGCDPFEKAPASHMECETPLNYAVASGSLSKTKTLLAGRDVKISRHRSAINRAVFTASAHNHTQIVEYLLNLIKVSLPNPEKWLKKYHTDSSHTDGHNALQERELKKLRQFTPKPTRADNQQTAKASLAIIASPGLENISSLMTSALSKAENITLLERDKLSAIVSESVLKNYQNHAQKKFHKTIDLLAAENILIISEQSLKQGRFIELATINCQTGMISSRIATSKKQLGEKKIIETYTKYLLNILSITPVGEASTIAISLTSIKPEIPTGKTLNLAHQTNVSLPYLISNTRGYTQLSRRHLAHLELENVIGKKGSYWQAAWIVDGSITTSPQSQHLEAITLIATNPINQKQVSISQPILPEALSESIHKAWSLLATKINLTKLKTRPAQQTTAEALLLGESSKWYQLANYPEEAVTYARAAMTLDPDIKYLYPTLLRAQIKTLTLSQSKACSHIKRNPRAINPKKKFLLARAIHEYISLADTATDYAATLNLQLVTQRGGTRSDSYNEIIHECLRELLFFRTIMDDAIILSQYKKDITTLDFQIKQLLTIYLRQIRGSKGKISEISTLLNLLKEDQHLYYYRKLPDIYAQILAHINQLVITPDRSGYAHDFAELLAKTIKKLKRHDLPLDPLMPSFAHFKKWRWSYHKPLMSAIITGLANSDEQRKKSRKETLALAVSHARDYRYFFDSRYLVENLCLTGTEFRNPQNSNRIRSSNIPQGAISSLLDFPPESLVETAELRRLWGLYIWRIKLETMDNSDWKKDVNHYQKHLSKLPEKKKTSSADWKLFSKLYEERADVDPEVVSDLKLLANPNSAPPTKDKQTLTIDNAICMPSIDSASHLGAFCHYGEISIAGDELWVPVTYIEAKQTSPLKHNKRHVIQVINLRTKAIQTVNLPDVTANASSGIGKGSSGTGKRPIVGENYCYYYTYKNDYSESKLFCISRKNYQATEIQLPLPRIKSISHKAYDDTVCISVAPYQRKNRGNVPSQVVLIKGDKIIRTLVSNHRKPDLSPLDSPDTLVTRIHHEKDQITLFSHHDMGYINSGKPSVAVFNIKTNKWQGWWYSPNELLTKKIYGIHIIGTWHDQVIISLKSNSRGLPAIWLVPKEEVLKKFRHDIIKK